MRIKFSQSSIRAALHRLGWQRRYRPASVKQMHDGLNGVAEKHAWPGPLHHLPDLLPLVRAVAMDDAGRTGWLGIAEHAALEALRCIFEQHAAVRAKRLAINVAVAAAIHVHHRCDGLQFARAPDEALVGGEFLGMDGFHFARSLGQGRAEKNDSGQALRFSPIVKNDHPEPVAGYFGLSAPMP